MAKKTPVKPSPTVERNGTSTKRNGAPAGEVHAVIPTLTADDTEGTMSAEQEAQRRGGEAADLEERDARILLVDDDVTLLEALPQAILLGMERVQIDTSVTGTDALERIKEVDYDAIVTDIKMPGMDGLALLEEIGQVRPGTPTLLITGHGEHDLAVRALRGGAYDFVAKPIDRDYFIASLERAIGMRRLDREVERQRLALQRHASVLEHVDDGVFLVDDSGVIQHWNPAAAEITGLTPSAVLGQRADDVLPDWRAVWPTVPVASVPGPGAPTRGRSRS